MEKHTASFLRIYAMTHKAFPIPPDPMYVPLQVGSATNAPLGYLRDDTGDNISDRNCYYSELTGLYWVWKNVADVEYVGTCHYRRYLIDEREQIYTEQQYRALLREYDLITTRKVHLNNSYHFGFAANHNIKALDMTGEVIRELYPEYHGTFVRLVNGPDTYFGNMFVTSKKNYDAYCKWLFSIFFEVAKRIDLDTDEDSYHKRVFGFISEFLLLVWVTVNKLSVYECKVGMLGEKVETREIKERLAEYFAAEDIAGAKDYFMKKHAERPDVLMEASDITGELRLAMQVIATADEEKRRGEANILQKEHDFRALMQLFTRINHIAAGDCAREADPRISDTALEIARLIRPSGTQS